MKNSIYFIGNATYKKYSLAVTFNSLEVIKYIEVNILERQQLYHHIVVISSVFLLVVLYDHGYYS
jgi:hypothetical protein